MNIELTAEEINAVKARVLKKLEADLYAQATQNKTQFAAEIVNRATQSVAEKLANEAIKSVPIQSVVARAVAQIEQRVQGSIEKVLSKGIKLTIQGSTREGDTNAK